MFPIFSSSISSPETREDGTLPGMSHQELERLSGHILWVADEREGVEVHGVCTGFG